MDLQTILYSKYEEGLPQEGNFVLGQTKASNIIVYQAFNNSIANYAVENQKFGGANYSFSRMTWIKPNFLWMMYRSGWATKENQNRILAIEITKSGFEELLTEGVLSTYNRTFESKEKWQQALNKSDIRLQWDPDHDYKGEKLKRRAIQIGIRGVTLEKFNDVFIKSIQDITPFVVEQKKLIDQNSKDFLVIAEETIRLNDDLNRKFNIIC